MGGKFTPAYGRYVLIALLAVYSINFMDRQIIAVLSPQIKFELGLSDTQLGFLKGTAFALFYATMSIPMAMLGDRMNRVTLISWSLAVWSGMTALTGLAGNFLHLFLCRMVVGVGEAGSTPPSHSLLADYFPREKRSTALAIYSLGVPIGTFLGLIVGGWLASQYGWRTTLLVLGVPGVFISLVVKLTVRDVPRGSADMIAAPPPPDGLTTVARQLWAIPTYRTMVLSGALNAFVGYAMSMWLVDFYVRSERATLAEVGLLMAIAFGVGGGIGTFVGGLAADKFGRRNPSNYLLIPGAAMLAAAPLTIAAVLVPHMGWSVACVFFASGLMYMSFGPLYGLVQTLAPINNRSLAIAFYFLFQSLVGSGLGPLSVGFASDQLSHIVAPDAALAIAIGTLCIPLSIAGLNLILQRRRLHSDLACVL
ncbi:MFS transporter [Sphingobium sp. D43FB]|uniref:spinster family MFS transporter n=1 Tax=Sphingobium sp. D43FB TaxID=2017595 RepID=UPI000BB53B47|nr:MFS transporter [Sphingobium sp. D43FB]PBN41841.1 MFS transporter [Sphingobium sp. D43FB]